jgi:hypothetical protein
VRHPGGCGAQRVARTTAWLCAALAALAPYVAVARELAGRTEVRLEWAPAAGEIGAYVVFVSRNGGPFRSEQYTLAPVARIPGSRGETVQVLVRAYALADGRTLESPPSPPSELIRFAPPESATPAPVSAAPPSAAAPPTLSREPFAPPLSIQAGGDFDGDGDLDLLATLDSFEHALALFLEGGRLEHLACLAPLGNPTAAFAADFDGDGRDELALRGPDAVSLLRLERPGTTTLLRREPLPAGGRVLAADLDGDDRASLVLYEPESGRLTERLSENGARDFGAIRPLHTLQVGDFDGDGRDDLWVQARSGGDAELWLMRDGGRFEVAPVRVDGSVGAAAALDWNGDGRDDLAAFDATRGELRAWLLDGARVIDRRALGRGPVESLHALDLNGDARDDLLVGAPGGTASALLSTP